ncbi:MAG: hypothetical protein LBR26_09560 [Prevotella sp.]|jgi:hypothetical protein|nr:hypothetical protein [Prevotella sp.]
MSKAVNTEAKKGEITNAVMRLSEAFPYNRQSFYTLLAERIDAGKFTKEQLERAVDHVIDTCSQLTIASVINAANEEKKSGYNFYRSDRENPTKQ